MGVDRVDLPAGGTQARGQQSAWCLDRYRDRFLGVVAMLGQQRQQRGQAGCIVVDPLPGQQPAIAVDQRDVVVILRPVDATEHVHQKLLSA